jgi:hypothetical protein
VLVSLIDKLLPADFYAPSLFASRADQRVLQELVAQYIPKLDQHLISLDVDLASVTFGWFLSLFTDCLPVEVSVSLAPLTCRHYSGCGMFSSWKGMMSVPFETCPDF